MIATGTRSAFAVLNKAAPENIWVSHHRRCLAFHAEPEFSCLVFPDKQSMWESVFQFLDRGYLVK